MARDAEVAVPSDTAVAAGTRSLPLRRGRRVSLAPYGLILPVAAAVVLLLGYPIYKLVRISFERYGLFELIQHQGHWIGLDNYRSVVNVGLTIVLGTLIALLLPKISRWVRILLTTGLVFVWAMPVVVAVQVFYWMTNFENGVLNYLAAELHLVGANHDWYATPTSSLGIVTLLIVWGALPFIVISVYAGLAQVPHELVEAARVDGAGPARIFRDVTFPVLKPILLILTSLSIIWDFGVFAQPYLLIGAAHIDATNYLMGVYVFIKGYADHDFGRGAAISLLMLLMVAGMSVFYVRQMVRAGNVK
jgi:N,N'-diacetylchitobiose transport system permease protein